MNDENFWKIKSLEEMTQSEWESLCDGCGKCCYRKYIDGYGKDEHLYFTRIACNLLDLKTGMCSDYKNRFKRNKECIHLTKKNISDFKWLPSTCAYRLIYEKKELPSWHPLISKSRKEIITSNVQIKDGIHEKDADNWEEFIIDEERI